MLHRTHRSASWTPALSGLAVILVLVIAAPQPVPALEPAAGGPETTLVLEFDAVEAHARASSPHFRVAEQELAVLAADRQADLQRPNPALAYDHEESDTAREWQLSLHQRFERPLRRGSLRDGWDGELAAARLNAEQAAHEIVAELRRGYIELKLREDHLARLDRLGELVDLAAAVAGSRHAEGELSGLDRRLVQLAAYAVDAARLRARQEQRGLLAEWRADMGIAAGRGIVLATPVTFRPAPLQDAAAYVDLVRRSPGARAAGALDAALAQRAAAARTGLLPAFELYGGYKRFADDDQGFVAGLALDLPVFDRGQGQASVLDARRRQAAAASAWTQARREQEAVHLVASLQEAAAALTAWPAEEPGSDHAGTLLLAYREGAVTLDQLLGAVQVETAALESRYAALAAYYHDIFRLEALTGAGLVNLGPQE